MSELCAQNGENLWILTSALRSIAWNSEALIAVIGVEGLLLLFLLILRFLDFCFSFVDVYWKFNRPYVVFTRSCLEHHIFSASVAPWGT